MSPAHRRYLLLEQGVGAFVVNFAINAGIAWALFRAQAEVPLWGQQSIAVDTILTCLTLPLLTTLSVTPMARGHVRRGRVSFLGWNRTSHPFLGWLPEGTFARGFVLGLVLMIAISPLTLLVLSQLHVANLTFSRFVLFKATFAAILGALVTPVIAVWAIADEPPARRAKRVRRGSAA
jgi:hypothetical protein